MSNFLLRAELNKDAHHVPVECDLFRHGGADAFVSLSAAWIIDQVFYKIEKSWLSKEPIGCFSDKQIMAGLQLVRSSPDPFPTEKL